VFVACAALLWACGGSGGPSGPSGTALQVACPADVTVASVMDGSRSVTYDAPVVTGGSAPLTTACTPASGSVLSLGRTPVTCTVSDSAGRTASCAFAISLTGFRIGVTTFDAIGDSLTAGEIGRPSIVDPPNAYPTRLQELLDRTYPGQGLRVLNNGIGGWTVGQTLAIIPKLLQADRPDVVLLLSGFNDLTGVCGPGQAGTLACAAARDTVRFGIRDCLRRVREANVGVKYTFVSTLTPPGPSGSNRIDADAIVQTNQRIRQVVAAEGGVLVDSYASFVGHEAEYVNVDGLHLRPAGYAALAEAFYAAIQTTIPQTPLLR
jgi:lysophospholipase L1-like esterase